MKDLTPYLDKESAILWLSRHLQTEGVDVKSMYHLNIVNNLIQDDKEIFRRTPQEVFGGLPEGGRRNVAASFIARAVSCTDREESQSVGASGYTRTQEIIGSWAEKDGCWHDYADSHLLEEGMLFCTSGSEANVYYKGANVYKVNDYNHYGTIEKLLDRISIHNAIFPEARLEVVGFGMKDDIEDNTGFSVILKQPLIQGDVVKNPEEVYNSLIGRNLLPLNASSWCFTSETKNIVLHDIHDQNMVRTAAGNIILYDCEALLNTDPMTKGHYIIPAVQGNEDSVRAIDEILNEICPRVFDMKDVAKANPTAASELYSKGEYNGLVTLPVNGKPTRMLVCLDELNTVLAVKPSTIYTMVKNKGITASEKEILASGKSFVKNGRKYFFNIKKGRLDSVSQRQIKKTMKQNSL